MEYTYLEKGTWYSSLTRFFLLFLIVSEFKASSEVGSISASLVPLFKAKEMN